MPRGRRRARCASALPQFRLQPLPSCASGTAVSDHASSLHPIHTTIGEISDSPPISPQKSPSGFGSHEGKEGTMNKAISYAARATDERVTYLRIYADAAGETHME